MKGQPVPQKIKELILERIRNGESVAVLAEEFKLYPNTLRKWMKVSGVQSSGIRRTSELLEISKLKREKQQLLEIIGELTVLNKQSKKKSS